MAESLSWAETLRNLGLCPAGGASEVLKKWVARWGISIEHFDPYATQRGAPRGDAKPLEEILVQNSSYSRGSLKRRLYQAGLKEPVCEMCGQDEVWNGTRISLILDHVNGVSTDNRLENLRIVCPNCAATLPTHCGRNVELLEPRICRRCGESFRARIVKQHYCSKACGIRSPGTRDPCPERRKVDRPPLDQVLREVEAEGYCAVARRYGVSDNAIRKWFRWAGVEPPRRTWPNRKRR